MQMIKFPSDINDTNKTFIQNKRINDNLYGLLLLYAKEINNQYVIFKNDLPSQNTICESLNICRTTLNTHLNYLTDNNYLIQQDDKYIINNPEKTYFEIPYDTLSQLIGSKTNYIIKIFIYFGQQMKDTKAISFTISDLIDLLGLSNAGNSSSYQKINNILDYLKTYNFIDYNDKQTGLYNKGKLLTNFKLNTNKIQTNINKNPIAKSEGQNKIRDLLYANNIPFSQEFPVVIDNINYRFDIAVYDIKGLKYFIEFDGAQHFDKLFKEKYNNQQRDKNKDKWCRNNNYPLIRIPYTIKDDLAINDLLLETTNYRVI